MSDDTTTTGHTRITVDLQDRIDEIDEAIDHLEDARDAIEAGDDEKADELLDGWGAEPTEEAVTDSKNEIEHSRDLLEADVQRFGGSEFTVKKFRAGEVAEVNDLVVADTLADGHDDPRSKLHARKLYTIQVGVTETPPDTPDEPARFEPPTTEYLFQCIDNLNTYGKVSLDDF